jgi:hypothetical protein
MMVNQFIIKPDRQTDPEESRLEIEARTGVLHNVSVQTVANITISSVFSRLFNVDVNSPLYDIFIRVIEDYSFLQ